MMETKQYVLFDMEYMKNSKGFYASDSRKWWLGRTSWVPKKKDAVRFSFEQAFAVCEVLNGVEKEEA